MENTVMGCHSLLQIWGDTRTGLIKLASENIYMKTCSASPLTTPHNTESLISALYRDLISGDYRRSAAAAAHDLILVERDTKCPW